MLPVIFLTGKWSHSGAFVNSIISWHPISLPEHCFAYKHPPGGGGCGVRRLGDRRLLSTCQQGALPVFFWLSHLPLKFPQILILALATAVSMCAQSCPTLCDSMDCSLPSSSVHGILQARILEWVAISSSRGSSQLRDWTRISCWQPRWH